MASESLNVVRLGGILECSVCLEKVRKPKNLPCGHTFCLECLIGYGKDGMPGDKIFCPLCRREFKIPPGGLEQLPSNFLIEQLLEAWGQKEPSGAQQGDDKCDTCSDKEASKFCVECSQDLCESCALIHGRARGTKTHKIVTQEDKKSSLLMTSSRSSYCEKHSDKQLELYCNDCETAICLKCSILDHGPHVKSDIDHASNKFKFDVLNSISSFDQLVLVNKMELKRLESEKNEFLNEISAAELAIKSTGEEVKRLVDSQVNELMEQLVNVKTDKLKELQTRKDDVERQIVILESHQQFVGILADKGTPCDVIRSNKDLVKTAGELLASQTQCEADRPTFLTVEFHKSGETGMQGISSGWTQILGTLSIRDKYEKQFVVIGLDNGTEVDQQIFHVNLSRMDTVSTIKSTPTPVQPEAAACTYAGSLYAVGLGEPSNELWKYTAAYEWIRLADMESGRRRHCVAVVGSMLYVLGGLDEEETLSSVLSYNISSNTWSTVGQLTHAVHNAAFVAFKDSIYVFGGDGGDDVRVDYVQMYNTVSQKCTLMPNAMPKALRTVRAVLWKTSAVLLHCFTCFIYNFETQTWLEREQYKTGVAHFGAVLNNTTLYIAGGGTDELDFDGEWIWTCSDEVKSVSVIDIISDKPAVWKHHAKLPQSTLICAFSSTPMSLLKMC